MSHILQPFIKTLSSSTLSGCFVVVLIISCGLLSFPFPSHAGTITPSLIPARTSGVAPLAVFFDASATTGSVTSAPFHDLLYTWSFGDSEAGNWSYGAKSGTSKNIAYGPLAAHVFETPGIYTVSLSIYDGTDTATTTTTITVSDPDTVFSGTATYCFSNDTDFTSCPSGATHVTTSSFSTAITTYQGTGRRLLFKRGNTFTASSAATVSATGPGIVGAFGTGNKPIFRATASVADLIIMNAADWRYMDFEVDGNDTGSGTMLNTGLAQNTILRLNVHNVVRSFYVSDFQVADQFAIHDNVVDSLTGGTQTNVWVFAQRSSIQGNSMTPRAGYHVLRLPRYVKGIIANNYLAYPGAGMEIIKLHQANPYATRYVWSGEYTEKVIIADNYLHGSDGRPWQVTISAQNAESDERLRDIIVESNYSDTEGGTQVFWLVSESDVTVRNNLVNMSNGEYQVGVLVGLWGTNPVPNNVKVYNNTIYSSTSGSFIGIQNNAGGGGIATNLQAINNLCSAPAVGSPTMLNFLGSSYTASNNLLNNTPSSLFVSATPSVPADFRLISGSPAIGAGLAVPVWQDFLGSLRDSLKDIGAFEYTSGGGGDTTPPAAPSGLSVF
jgi:hypothetical protein